MNYSVHPILISTENTQKVWLESVQPYRRSLDTSIVNRGFYGNENCDGNEITILSILVLVAITTKSELYRNLHYTLKTCLATGVTACT